MAQLQMGYSKNHWLYSACFIHRIVLLFDSWSRGSENVWRVVNIKPALETMLPPDGVCFAM